MTLIAQVDEYACAAHGDCALIAPDVFAVEDIAVVVGAGTNEAVLQAARACPAAAIAVIDEETREQVYP